jgi:structural maintenance of chromosome 4
VIREYERRNEAYLLRIRDLEAITEQRTKLRLTHEKLRKMRLREFFDGFRVISDRLKEMYQTITIGGDAELQPVDTMDPFGDGIEFSVRPPKKSWKQIQNLSGGEAGRVRRELWRHNLQVRRRCHRWRSCSHCITINRHRCM